MEPTASDSTVQQQYGMTVGIPNAGQVNALGTINIRGERSVTCKGEFDKPLAKGALPAGAPPVCEEFRKQPDALERAAELDAQYGRNPDLTAMPMYCIPFSFKDPFDTKDMRSTGGADARYDIDFPARDHVLVDQLRKKGAIIYAKSVLTEYNGRAGNPGGKNKPEKVLVSTEGFQRSTWGGNPSNPYDTTRAASLGSSSGSGAAVAANLCALAVGTETDGSVVCPASANGIVGIKPTLGLLSRSGIIPIAHSQDTPGPMARTVRDAAILLNALAGTDPRDPATAESAARRAADYARSLDPNGLRGARIGVARKYFGFSDAVDDLMNSVMEEMKRQGAVLVDPADLESHGKFDDTEFLVLLYELKADLESYLASRPDARVRSLKDIIEFNERNKEKEMPYFAQDTFIKAEAKGSLTSKEYLDALEANRRLARAEGIDGLMDKHHLDAIMAPTGSPAWLTDLVNGDHSGGGSSNAAAVAGYPDISVPAGSISGLPVGVSFFGRAWSEPVLLKIAYGFEQAIKARKPPRFLPNVQSTKS